MRGLLQLAMLGSTAFWGTNVYATSNYVGAVNNYPYAGNADAKCGWIGTCVLCHAVDPGTKGTVIKAFGRALMDEYGLVGNDQSNKPLIAALDQAKAESLDADGDGIADIDEICGGGDPNDANLGLGGAAPAVLPEYGCMGALAVKGASSKGSGFVVAALIAVGLAWTRRRRVRV